MAMCMILNDLSNDLMYIDGSGRSDHCDFQVSGLTNAHLEGSVLLRGL
jgi:hypothetical protein